jgi:formate-dependent phosphoribosylglycinamide formyltransferase (GAR transformylase)
MSQTRSRSLGRFPSDPAARERLREAQEAEAKAVAAYYSAAANVDNARFALAATEAEMGAAVRAVIAISGQGRALVVLGLDKADLRKAIASAQPQGSGDHQVDGRYGDGHLDGGSDGSDVRSR